jgi:hypothetical protein
VLVPRGGEAPARELLGTRAAVAPADRAPAPRWVRTLALVLALLVVGLVVAGLVSAVVR